MFGWFDCNHKRSIEYSTKYRGQKREKIQALSLAKDCYSMKLELLTNATVVNDATRFVSFNKSRDSERQRSASSSNNEESKKPDYDEGKDQLGEEQEEETGEMAATINRVF
jgi:hypothetical protein